MWWQGAGLPLPDGRFDLAYKVRLSDYRGQRDIQVEWVDARPSVTPVIEVRSTRRIHIIDLRADPDPMQAWNAFGEKDWILWREGEALQDERGSNRYELSPHPTLLIGTIPPGRQELAAALEIVEPSQVILLGLQPGSDQPDAFLKRLAGLVQYALRARAGQVTLAELAAATGQREVTVQWGLDWLVARGYITRIERAAGSMVLASGGTADPLALQKAERSVRALLEETAAFRAYFRDAEPSALVASSKSR
jgi:single-stranded-DNA-specific exonuclease